MADKKISALPAATTPLAGTEVLPIVQGGTTDQVSVANLTAGRAVSTGALTVVAADATLDNAYSLKGKLVAGTAVSMLRRNSSDEVAIDEDGYGTKIGFGGRYNFAGGGDFTVGVGNLVVGTAGKGIDFSANAHAAGMTSELLNWYEEGTWTPVLSATTTAPSVTYANRTARYTRVGRLVTVHAWLNISSQSGGAGNVIISGLPFTAANTGANISVVNLGVLQNIDPGAGNLNAAYVVNNTTDIALAASPQNSGGWSDLPVTGLGASSINIMLSASYLV